MLLHDLDNEGQPAARQWNEVYGVLSGTQLAIWDAQKLSSARYSREKFQESSSKPDYLNLADASYKALLSLPSSGKALNNVILISTTLKNRYILQFPTKDLLLKWHAAFRLLTFEYVSLQEAYTGALLSARGAKLSDIKVVLAESKYNHEHWISVRFGAGRPWKRCYAVVEQNSKRSKRHPERNGKIYLYEHEKIKKAPLIATIIECASIYAVYPNSPQVIDHSTLIKLEGKVIFNKKEGVTDATVFVMPESHSAVPGYDTLIRFLIPSLDAFRLYGRPKKLNADKRDPASLLFGLPVLPHVHYLQLDDVIGLSQMSSSILWPVDEWTSHLKDVLKSKMSNGYSGCGSAHGFTGALSSPALGGGSGFSSKTASPTNPNFTPTPKRDRFSRSLDSSGTLFDKNGNAVALAASATGALNSNYSLPADATTGGGSTRSRNNSSSANQFGSTLNPYSNDASNNPYQQQVQPPTSQPNSQLSLNSPYSLPSDQKATSNPSNLSVGNGNPLPLPSDNRSLNHSQNSFVTPNGSFSELALPSDQLQHQQSFPNSYNRNSISKELPLPSDQKKDLSFTTAAATVSQFTGNKSADLNDANSTKSNNPYLSDLQIPSNNDKRLSEITQIYTDYAKIPSPKEKSKNSVQNLFQDMDNSSGAVDKLNIANEKEVDDAEFDLSTMLSQTKIQEKRHSKKDVDIFNPAYSEALLSPVSGNGDVSYSARNSMTNGSVNGNGSVSIDSNGSPSRSTKYQSQQLKPTLPQINIDDDDYYDANSAPQYQLPNSGGGVPYPQTPTSPVPGSKSPFQQSPSQFGNGNSSNNYSPLQQRQAPAPVPVPAPMMGRRSPSPANVSPSRPFPGNVNGNGQGGPMATSPYHQNVNVFSQAQSQPSQRPYYPQQQQPPMPQKVKPGRRALGAAIGPASHAGSGAGLGPAYAANAGPVPNGTGNRVPSSGSGRIPPPSAYAGSGIPAGPVGPVGSGVNGPRPFPGTVNGNGAAPQPQPIRNPVRAGPASGMMGGNVGAPGPYNVTGGFR